MKFWFLSLLTISCVACIPSEKPQDLTLFIEKAYQEKNNHAEQHLELPRYEAIDFVSKIDRNPFVATFLEKTKDKPMSCDATKTSPKLGMLSNVKLSNLLFKGIIKEGVKSWALIMAPDKSIYRVTLGQVIGSHRGKINRITSKGLFITEYVKDSQNCWQKRQVKVGIAKGK